MKIEEIDSNFKDEKASREKTERIFIPFLAISSRYTASNTTKKKSVSCVCRWRLQSKSAWA